MDLVVPAGVIFLSFTEDSSYLLCCRGWWSSEEVWFGMGFHIHNVFGMGFHNKICIQLIVFLCEEVWVVCVW